MSLETTVFTFKISVPFEEWAAVYDSEENIQMNKERGIICLYKGLKKDDPTSVILIEQGEEGKSIAMFEDPAVKALIESAAKLVTLESWTSIGHNDAKALKQYKEEGNEIIVLDTKFKKAVVEESKEWAHSLDSSTTAFLNLVSKTIISFPSSLYCFSAFASLCPIDVQLSNVTNFAALSINAFTAGSSNIAIDLPSSPCSIRITLVGSSFFKPLYKQIIPRSLFICIFSSLS